MDFPSLENSTLTNEVLGNALEKTTSSNFGFASDADLSVHATMKLNKIRTTSLFINPSLAEPCRDITIKIVQELAHGGVFPVLVDWVIGLTPGIHFEIDFFVIHSLVIIHFGA